MNTGVVSQTDPQVDLDRLLSTRFGFDTFREGQREVIEHLLAGHSAAIYPHPIAATQAFRGICRRPLPTRFNAL